MSGNGIENKSQDGKQKGMNKNFMILALIVVIVALLGMLIAGALIDIRLPLSEEEPVVMPRHYRFDQEREDPKLLETHLKLKTAITFANMTISLMLIFIYCKIYKQTKAQFTVGLIVVMVSFFVYALTANPIIPRLLGLKPISFGLFSMVPDIFALVALITLLYISQK